MTYTINGKQYSREHNFEVRYAELLESLGEKPSRVLTVTWCKSDGRGGTIAPGQSLVVTDGTIINVADTSNA